MEKTPLKNNLQKLFFLKKRVLALLLIAILCQLSLPELYSQTNKTISLKEKQIPLSKLFTKIEKQTGYLFFYVDSDINNIKVDIEVSNQTIDQILLFVLRNTGLSYKISGNNVNIVKDKPKKEQKKRIVSGEILDDLGEPVIGANVRLKGANVGAISDFDGKFSINDITDESTLVISFMGYVTQEIKVGKKNSINVQLAEDTQALDEVVVVGYGTQKKESVVGAITQVDSKALTRAGVTDVTSAIAGKLSGVVTMQQSGQPGHTENNIIIRGVSSWNGSNPLVLVDGVERAFKDLDPNEINTISVLKDASATAVFGAKGGNGVIIVTTKRGVESKPKLDISASTGLKMPTRIPQHIDSYKTMSMYNIAQKNQGNFAQIISDDILEEYRNPSSRLNSLRYPDVDWFSLLARSYAPTTTVNLNLRGGTSFIRYFASLGYLNEGSLFNSFNEGYADTRYNYDRINFRANLDFLLTKSTTLSFNVGGDISTTKSPSTAPWEALYQTSTAMFPAYFPDWVLSEVPDTHYPKAAGSRLASTKDANDNPYSILYQGRFNQYTGSKLYTDLVLKQNFDFITKGLSFQSKASFNTFYHNRSLTANWIFPTYELDFAKIGTDQNPWKREGESEDVWVQDPLDINVGGLTTSGGNAYYKNLYYEFSLNYDRTFEKHRFTALALMSRQQKRTASNFPYYNESWVGRLTYDYNSRYLFEFNIGYTGSERFSPQHRFGLFPAGAIGWMISEESFIKDNLPWLNKMKLRYSDGLVGSDAAAQRWLYISDYEKSGAYIYEGQVPNLSAQWEETRKRNLGLEFGIFNDTFTASVDIFDEFRDKMLLGPRTTTMLIGNNGFKQMNLGKLKKHGFEIELGFNKKTSFGLNYNLKAMFAFNENRIIDRDDPARLPDYKKSAGKPLGANLNGVVLAGNGYFNTVDDIHSYPSPASFDKLNVGDYRFLDYTADGIISDLDQYAIRGSLYPPISYSFSSGATYKNFDFQITLQGNAGKYVEYNESFEIEFNQGSYRVHESQIDYWTPTNHNAQHSTLHYYDNVTSPMFAWAGGDSYHGYKISVQDRFWRKADYLRLRDVYLGYTFSSKQLKEYVGVSNLTVYASGNNIFTFTNLIEGDPERRDFKKGFYPQMTTYKLGLKIGF